MVNVIKGILFILVNAAGFYAMPVILALAVKYNFMPSLPADSALFHQLAVCLDYIEPFVWIVAGLASIGYFFVRGELRTWLILAPIYVPVLYLTLVLVYFNFAKIS